MTTLVDELKELDRVTERRLVTYAEAKFVADGKHNFLKLDKEEFKLGESAFKSMAEDLDVPFNYIARVPADLREHTVNYFLKARKDSNVAALVNTEQKSVRSFVNPQYPYVPTLEMYSMFDNTIEVANYRLTDEALELVTFMPVYETDIVDSQVKAGIRLLYSDAWTVYPRFDAYLCRIECFNSSICPIVERKFRVSKKSEQDILDQAESFLDDAMANIQPMIDGFKRLQHEKVDQWVAVIQKICAENRLPKKLAEQIIALANNAQFLATVSSKEIKNMYDVVNLLTYYASHHPEVSDAHREHIFAIAGNIMVHNDHRCNSCGGKV